MSDDEDSILHSLDSLAPESLAQFDAFPKLPLTYKSRSDERGFLTIFVALVAVLLVLNDLGEFIWGWPDTEFSVDHGMESFMRVNLDMVVNMPCHYLSVDLKDAVGDRLYLTSGIQLEGTFFDVSQATTMKAHSEALSASQAVAQSRKSRGFFATLFRRTAATFRPLYKHIPNESACRISGNMVVKKVTANLHITVLGHGYRSPEYVDYSKINISHVITEFSFGPYFPEITQPLDYTYELTHENYMAYQYYIHIVPTTYIAPRSSPLHTNQYSVTNYIRPVQVGQGAPGIFFKFDLEPLHLTVIQRTTTFTQLIIRCVGVIGGVFVCMGYAVRITYRAVDVVAGRSYEGTIAAASSGVKVGLREKWGGGSLRARPNKLTRRPNEWTVEGSPAGPPFNSYTAETGFPMMVPRAPYTPPLPSVGNPRVGSGGLGIPFVQQGSAVSSPGYPLTGATIPTAATIGSHAPYSPPLHAMPSYAHFPPTPGLGTGSLASPALLGGDAPPPPRQGKSPALKGD